MYKVTPVALSGVSVDATPHNLRDATGAHQGRYMAVGAGASAPNLLTVPLVGETETPKISSECTTLYKLNNNSNVNAMQFFVGSGMFTCDAESLQPRSGKTPLAPHKNIAPADLPGYFFVASDWNPATNSAGFKNSAQVAARVRDMVANHVSTESMSSVAVHQHAPMRAILEFAAGGECRVQTDSRNRTLKLRPGQSPPDLGAFLDVGAFIASKMAQGLPVLSDPATTRQPNLHVAQEMRDHTAMCELLYAGITDPESAMLSATAQQVFSLPLQHVDVSCGKISNAKWSKKDGGSQMKVTMKDGKKHLLASVATADSVAPDREIHTDREYTFLGLVDTDSQVKHMLVEGQSYPYCATMGSQLVCHESDQGLEQFVSSAAEGHPHAARLCINGSMPLSHECNTIAAFAKIADVLESDGPQAGAQRLLESWTTCGIGAASVTAPTAEEWPEVSAQIGVLVDCCQGAGEGCDCSAEDACVRFVSQQHQRMESRMLGAKCDALDSAVASFAQKRGGLEADMDQLTLNE